MWREFVIQKILKLLILLILRIMIHMDYAQWGRMDVVLVLMIHRLVVILVAIVMVVSVLATEMTVRFTIGSAIEMMIWVGDVKMELQRWDRAQLLMPVVAQNKLM